jgi:hypothetical protein
MWVRRDVVERRVRERSMLLKGGERPLLIPSFFSKENIQSPANPYEIRLTRDSHLPNNTVTLSQI